MKRNILILIAACILSFSIGWISKPAPVLKTADLGSLLSGLRDGDSITLTEREIATGGITQNDSITPASKTIEAKDGGAFYWRGLSWFGQGGPEAATQHQGLNFDKNGELSSVGTNKGTGILERFWSWLKSVFWTVILIGLPLLFVGGLLVAYNPGGIGSYISRFVGWITGPIGAIFEFIHSHVTAKAPLATLQAAVDNFPTLINALPSRAPADTGEGFTDGQKATVLTIHSNTHQA